MSEQSEKTGIEESGTQKVETEFEKWRRETNEAAKKRKRIIFAFVCAGVILIAYLIVHFTVILPNANLRAQYRAAAELQSTGQYEEAIEAFSALGNYKDSREQIELCKTAILDKAYEAAGEFYRAGKLEEAYAAYSSLGTYKDSRQILEELLPILYQQRFVQAKVGSTVFFGRYEQDRHEGKDEIEWLVLEKEETRFLLISKYALDCKAYSPDYTPMTWEESPLRAWLNETFYEEAFSEEEREMIREVDVPADQNPMYPTNSGNDTQDRVFLLSISEAQRYFSSASALACTGTDYCWDQGADQYENGNCWWWLRTPGENPYTTAYVRSDGTIAYWGDPFRLYLFDYYIDVFYGVRPAIWIDIEALEP